MIKYLCVLACFIITSCAQQIPPTGGDKDEIPPKVIGTKPINQTSNFKEKKITIEFDEFIQIKENKNIIISPKPNTKTQIISDGKKLIFEFKEKDLDTNTTYTISLINAIADIHEGKLLNEYQYVFSTGNFIDTAQINGEVINSLSNQTENDYTVVLSKYKNNKDSNYYKKNISYITKTNEAGKFSFKNIPIDSFEVFAFNDKNNNNTLDKNEENGFASNVVISNIEKAIKIVSFKQDDHEMDKLLDTIKINPFIHQFVVFNYTNFKINKPSRESFYLRPIKSASNYDTITVFNLATKDTIGASSYLIKTNNNKLDSIRIIGKKSRDKRFDRIEIQITPITKPDDSIYIQTNLPIKLINKERLTLKQDTIYIDTINLIRKDDFTMIVTNRLEPNKTYNLEIRDSSIQSIYNQYNTNKKQIIIPAKKEDFGGIQIKNIEMNDSNILIQIVDSKDFSKVIYNNYLDKKQYNIENLTPGTYKIRFVKDSNKNGYWDNGDILKQKQPELICYLKDEINIKAYWDIEIVIKKDDIIFN